MEQDWTELKESFCELLELSPVEQKEKLSKFTDSKRAYLVELLESHQSSTPFLEPSFEMHSLALKSYECDQVVENDYKLLSLLGESSVAKVFLSKQISLNRLVALKLTVQFSDEAQMMAGLEHNHIVKIFHQFIDSKTKINAICMEYISGTTLQNILNLQKKHDFKLSMTEILDFIGKDKKQTHFDSSAFKTKLWVEKLSWEEWVLWMANQVGSALSFAHQKNILHLDIKPANILIDIFGRPKLTDFNVSVHSGKDTQVLGGTYLYMACEHKLYLETLGQSGSVSEKSDIYSLGRVLEECQSSRALSYDIKNLIHTCIEQRTSNAHSLTLQIENVFNIRKIQKILQKDSVSSEKKGLKLVTLLCALILLPHIVGDLLNIVYNSLNIVSHLNLEQRKTFNALIFQYNTVAYPLSVFILIKIVLSFYSYLREPFKYLGSLQPQIRLLTLRLLKLPKILILVSTFIWLPGGFIFPFLIERFSSQSVGSWVYQHFIISFIISWGIVLSYSYFLTLYFIVRHLYPIFSLGFASIISDSQKDLKKVLKNIHFFQVLCFLFPLFGILVVAFNAETVENFSEYRVLILFLTGLLLFSYFFSSYAFNRVKKVVSAYIRLLS